MSDESYRFEKQWRGAGVALPVFSLRTANSWRAKTDESNTLFTSFFLEGSLQPVRSAQKQYTEVVSSGSVLRFNLRCAQIETGDQ
eukprot:Pgem_evm1s12368